MKCKQCNRELVKSKDRLFRGYFCGYPCRNAYYRINERTQISSRYKSHKIPTISRKAFIFFMWYYHGVKLRKLSTINNIKKEIPYLLRDDKFKQELEKCIK